MLGLWVIIFMDDKLPAVSYHSQIIELVNQYNDAEGLMMKLANFAGDKIEGLLKSIPDGFEAEIQKMIKTGLEKAYDTSEAINKNSLLPNVPNYFHKTAVTLSGAVGGLTGLPGAVAELPITITTMFSSFQRISEQYGFDRSEPETKLECLKVFSMGGPLNSDDDLDLSFVSARIGLNGQMVSNIISAASKKLIVVITNKLGAQSVPILGAITGATLNYAFINYYEEMAHIRFKLKQLQLLHPNNDPLADFIQALEKQKNKAYGG